MYHPRKIFMAQRRTSTASMKKPQESVNHRAPQPVIPTERLLKRMLLGALLVGTFATTGLAQVTNNFETGDPGDGYPGSVQNGWADTWTTALGSNAGGNGFITVGPQVINTTPVTNGGNNYLNVGFANGDNNLIRRKYTSFADLDVVYTHIIEFDYRVDSWLPASGFTSTSDNVTIAGRPNISISSSDNRSTFFIKAMGANDSSLPLGKAARWNFYEGSATSSSESAGLFTNAAAPAFVIGRNYHFKIITDPTTKTYIGSVTDGTNTFTTQSLRWRNFVNTTSENDRTNATILYFASRTSTRTVQPAATETNIFSIDNVTINRLPFNDYPSRITQNSPATRAIHHPAASGMSFTVLTVGPTNTIPASGVVVNLNGTNISGLVLSGADTDTNRTVTVTNLAINTIYDGTIIVADGAGRKATNSFSFDTFVEADVTVIEAENYNFGPTNLCAVARTNHTTDGYLQNPVPSTYGITAMVYTNEVGGYVDRSGNVDASGASTPGVDYLDLTSPVTLSEYRFCDSMDTRTIPSAEYYRPAYTNSVVPDYTLEKIQAGEWCNYTHIFPATNYLVYLRVGARAAMQFQLSRVTSDRKQPNQTTVSLGVFNVPLGATKDIHTYKPLVDAFGTPLLLNLSGEQTLRLTSVNAGAGDDANVNFILFQPFNGVALPTLAQFSPGLNASNVPPQSDVRITIQNGSTPVSLGSIILKINGSNVTSSATITPTGNGASVTYLPATFFLTRSNYTVQIIYGDTSGNLQTNQWSFHVGTYLPGMPVRVNFQITNNVTPAGYLPDTSVPFGDRGNGFSYGWNKSMNQDSRSNNPAINSSPNTAVPPDLRYATFTHFNKSSPIGIWEITLPNGNYSVHAVSGDATAIDSVFKITVEGVLVVDGTPFHDASFDSNSLPNLSHWVEGTQSVALADGNLTLTTGGNSGTAAGGNNNKINFIDIIPLDFPPPDFSLHNPSANDSTFSFNISTINRALHIIEYKNALTAATWTTLTNIVGTGNPVTVNDNISASTNRFYRMRIP